MLGMSVCCGGSLLLVLCNDAEVDGFWHFFVCQGKVQYLFDIMNIVKGQSFEIDRLDFLNVFAVLRAQYDVRNAGPFGVNRPSSSPSKSKSR